MVTAIGAQTVVRLTGFLDGQDRMGNGVLGQSGELWVRTGAGEDLRIAFVPIGQIVLGGSWVGGQIFRCRAQQSFLVDLGHVFRAYRGWVAP